MDRAERTGFGVAIVGHLLLFAALSLNLLKPPKLPKLDAEPIEVSLVDKVALESSAPQPTPSGAPAAAEPETADAQTPPPAPEPKIEPTPAPKPVAKAPVPPKTATKPEPAKAKPAQAQRRPGLSRDLV